MNAQTKNIQGAILITLVFFGLTILGINWTRMDEKKEIAFSYGEVVGRCKEIGGEWLPVKGVVSRRFAGKDLVVERNELYVIRREASSTSTSVVLSSFKFDHVEGFVLHPFLLDGDKEFFAEEVAKEGTPGASPALSFSSVPEGELRSINRRVGTDTKFENNGDSSITIPRHRALCEVSETLKMDKAKAVYVRGFFGWRIESDETKTTGWTKGKTVAQDYFEHWTRLW